MQDRSLAAPGLLAAIIVGKYCDHLPLYRQEQIWRTRHHLDIPRQRMARWLAVAADWLRPVYYHIRTGVMADGYVQIDETPVCYLSSGHGTTRQGYFWTCKRPGGEAFFHWAVSRAASCLEAIIPADFRGIVQCDGYAAYPAHARTRQDISLAACWTHVRREFYEAKDSAPQHAGFLLLQIGHLYRLGATLLHLQHHRSHLPQSAMGKAISYTLQLWSQLELYLNDGRIQIDNNPVENAIRPTALGKKNWLFIGEAQAGQRSAILYTVIESCRTHRIDPFHYLRTLLTRLPALTTGQIKDHTPAAYALAHAKAKPSHTPCRTKAAA